MRSLESFTRGGIENLPTDEVVLYVDEVDIHKNPKIEPDWTKRGRQKMVLTPGCNEKRYLAGAWNPNMALVRWLNYRRRAVSLDILGPSVMAQSPGP